MLDLEIGSLGFQEDVNVYMYPCGFIIVEGFHNLILIGRSTYEQMYKTIEALQILSFSARTMIAENSPG
jgi:hypothetical protein